MIKQITTYWLSQNCIFENKDSNQTVHEAEFLFSFLIILSIANKFVCVVIIFTVFC